MTIEKAKAKVVSVARAEVGYREGANNWTKYAADPNITKLYGWTPQNQPWCCTFVNWCFMTAFGYDIGSRLTFGGTAACNNSAQLFKNHGAFTNSPQLGDQAFYYSGSGINHTGIVVEVSGNSFTAVEGNYSDKVSYVKHQITQRDVAGFGRPNWQIVSSIGETDSSTVPSTDTAKPVEDEHKLTLPLLSYGSTGTAVALLQSLLTMWGFECGKIDGEFGALTQAAVNRFQQWAKLSVDGIVGSQTWMALMKVG